jgi:hypothetical protein
LSVKHRTGLTDAIARDLGILTLSQGASPATPRFLARVEYGESGPVVRLTFWKYGHEGVVIETRRGEGTAIVTMLTTASPARDTRPLLTPGQPELRSYRMRYWHKGDPTGEWTPWKQLAVGPG